MTEDSEERVSRTLGVRRVPDSQNRIKGYYPGSPEVYRTAWLPNGAAAIDLTRLATCQGLADDNYTRLVGRGDGLRKVDRGMPDPVVDRSRTMLKCMSDE